MGLLEKRGNRDAKTVGVLRPLITFVARCAPSVNAPLRRAPFAGYLPTVRLR
jgi:hypothetical protein